MSSADATGGSRWPRPGAPETGIILFALGLARLDAQVVQQAHGYRSMGPYRSDGVSNIGDYFWGQGPVGPAPPMTLQMGMWSISGTG